MTINCLIIEDEPIAVEILETYIEKAFLEKKVNKIPCLQEAIEMIYIEKPDLIFLDINTKGIDTYRIRELVKNDILIMVTTAYPKVYIEETLQIDLAGLGYLHKPISYDSFVKELVRMIE